MFYILVAIITILILKCNSSMVNPTTNLTYNTTYQFNINNTFESTLEFTPPKLDNSAPVRVKILSKESKIEAPLMIVARQPRQLLSWQLPLIVESTTGNKIYNTTSRTLCHDPNSKGLLIGAEYYNPVLTISTDSSRNVSFNVSVDYETHFVLQPDVEYNIEISPSEPRFFYYGFPKNSSHRTLEKDYNFETVILEVYSADAICMTVSIQNISCPVFDTNQDITFRGFYETVSTKGGITILKDKFPNGFYAVFVAKADNSDCVGEPYAVQNGVKKLTVIIKPSIAREDYINAVLITLSAIGGFYLIFGIGFFVCARKCERPRQMEYVDSAVQSPIASEAPSEIPTDNISVDEAEYDTINDTDTDRMMRFNKPALYLCDLARKDIRVLRHKSYLYLYNVLTVAIFYGLPVVQLVVTYQKVLDRTGEQDLCYYNFLCAHPLGVISDFNHIFSNIGYIMFGILFIWITYRRESTHKDLDFERQYGIPEHYGMFYAMGVSLIMEGVLSASYHVCPNQANFQFDSSFMYVMAVLSMVKLYQNRHPDINATACATFGVLAIAIVLAMIGIFEENTCFWTVFTVIYILACLYFSAQFYYMGCWSLDRGVFARIYRSAVNDFQTGLLSVFKPVHKARMILIIIGNVCNWALAFWGCYNKKDFAFFLLTVFMANTLLYFIFYVLMKCLKKESVNKISIFYLFISTVCASSAIYFFIRKGISWSKTPAQSREFNHECQLLRFYDSHDIWHFLSAVGMFFTFMVLLTLDDDLSHTHRSQIHVF